MMTEASLSAARKSAREAAFQRLDAVIDRLEGVSLTRAAALGETSEYLVRHWATERGRTDLFNRRIVTATWPWRQRATK